VTAREPHEVPVASRSGVALVAEASLPTRHGAFRVALYHEANGRRHLALIKGDVAYQGPVAVRLHSECMTGDVFGSERCDCGPQLDAALDYIGLADAGVVLYLDQEGRGIGLINKLRAYQLQEDGLDTVEANIALGFDADHRDYTAAAQILADLGINEVLLLTNNPRKIQGLTDHGITVAERVPVLVAPGPSNRQYLETKAARLGHLMTEQSDAARRDITTGAWSAGPAATKAEQNDAR
jgi:3,4-dihydroxy 2-butanone 4-phosphate synthase / GTP cyclohydrolase II